ncbi:MAG: cytidylate kinase-like family protein [Clostridiales bacterium]|nr:cytidylate kinase-like family protein [Clostridiales bacterium]
MKRRIIAINRMFGSSGRQIGHAIADSLGIRFYDKELIEMAGDAHNIPYDTLARVDEQKANPWYYPIDHDVQVKDTYTYVPMNDVLFDTQRKIILDLARQEDCVIVGRCAANILNDSALTLFIHAPFDDRIRTVMERTGREEASAKRLVRKMDKQRRTYYEYFTDRKWMDMTQYDLCLDSSRLGTDRIVRIVRNSL